MFRLPPTTLTLVPAELIDAKDRRRFRYFLGREYENINICEDDPESDGTDHSQNGLKHESRNTITGGSQGVPSPATGEVSRPHDPIDISYMDASLLESASRSGIELAPQRLLPSTTIKLTTIEQFAKLQLPLQR